MTNDTLLPIDHYYRGYRCSVAPNGAVSIWFDADPVDTASSTAVAHATIDIWLDAK